MLPEVIPLFDPSTVVTRIQTRNASSDLNTITFSIQIKGAVPAVTRDEVLWTYAPNQSSPSVKLTESSSIKLSVSNDIASLTITRIELSHKGVYTAVINHPAGQVLVPSIELDVQGMREGLQHTFHTLHPSCEYY